MILVHLAVSYLSAVRVFYRLLYSVLFLLVRFGISLGGVSDLNGDPGVFDCLVH